MKTVVVTNRSRELKRLLAIAKHEDVVMQTPDGDEFMISMIDELGNEIAQQRRDKKLMAFLDARLRQARARPGIPLKDVRKQLGLNSHGTKVPRRKAR